MPVPQWERIHRADEPRLRHPIPALNLPIENANQTLNRVVATLYRGGSNPGNPILAGLATRIQFNLATTDEVRAAYVYQERAKLGPNLASKLLSIAPGIVGLDVVFGAGLSVAGSPAAGAKRNFVRLQSKFGTIEREFWVKTKDADIIALAGMPALDPDTLAPVPREVSIVGDEDWLDVPIDFFVSWNDEFQVLHNAKNPYLDTGFLKAYGGSQFVTFFDTTPGTQGIGVIVNPVTDAPIRDQHIIQVQNTPGDKPITVRFRAKAGSPYYVDVPIIIRVGGEECVCPPGDPPPVSDEHVVLFCDEGDPPPPEYPGAPNVVEATNAAWPPGAPVAQQLVLVSLQGAVVGNDPRIVVRRWSYTADITKPSGSLMTRVGDDLSLIPQQYPAPGPVLPAPYGLPRYYRVAFDFNLDGGAGVAFYEIFLKTGDLTSKPILIAGPRARDIANFPMGQSSVCIC